MSYILKRISMVGVCLVGSLMWVVVFVLSVMGSVAHAADECGGTSTFTSSYSAHSSSPSPAYGAGTIVSTGSGGTLRLWAWTSMVTTTTAPTTGNSRGWTDVTTQYAAQKVVCDSSDSSLSSTSNISYDDTDLLVEYDSSVAVNSITHTGTGGEIHLLSGAVSRGEASGSGYAVQINNSNTDTLRLVTSSGTSITNQDTTSDSHAVYVFGRGNVDLDLAGSTSAAARASTDTGNGNAAIYAHSEGGSLDIDITGGTHMVGGGGTQAATLLATLRHSAGSDQTMGTGSIDVLISGSSTVLQGPGSAQTGVIFVYGRLGADSVTIGATSNNRPIVCAGTLTVATGLCETSTVALALLHNRQIAGVGSFVFTNWGYVTGGIKVQNTPTTTITNEVGAAITGFLDLEGSGADTVENKGILGFVSSSDFGGGTDSFTSSGTLIVHHLGPTTILDNLETFTLDSGGTLRFTVPNNHLLSIALLDIGDAAPTLAGNVEYVRRDHSAFPTSGQMLLLIGSQITSATDISSLSLATAITSVRGDAALRLARGKVILSFGDLCGALTPRTARAPGVATRQMVCDRTDSLTSGTDIRTFEDGIAVIYGGGSTPVRSLINDGAGGEVHILSGSVVRPESGIADTTYDVVRVGLPVILDPTTSSSLRSALSATNPLGTQGTPGYLTAAEVFARDNTVSVTTAPDTFVRNLGVGINNRGLVAHGAGGHVYMTIDGDTYVQGMGSRGLYAVTSGAGNITVGIRGGIHTAVGSQGAATTALEAWLRPGPFGEDSVRPTGRISIDITGHTRVGASFSASSPEDGGAIFVNPEWSDRAVSETPPETLMHTVNIGADAVVCRGTFNRRGDCQSQGQGYAILLSNTGVVGNARSTPAFRVTNEGRLFGGIKNVRNARGVSVTNRGSILGNFVSDYGETDFGAGTMDGSDVVLNDVGAIWIMTRGATFGDGVDTFTNRGTLVLRYTGTPIVMSGLETFSQEAGATLRIEIDPRRFGPDGADADDLPDPLDPALPSGPIINFGDARGSVEGTLQVFLLHTVGMHGGLTPDEVRLLITALDDGNEATAQDTMVPLLVDGHNLVLSTLKLPGRHLVRDASDGNLITYDLAGTPFTTLTTLDGTAVLETSVPHIYDSVIQASWFAHYALLRSLDTPECTFTGSMDKACGWMTLDGRLFTHERNTISEVEEGTFSVKGGVKAFAGGWTVNTTVAYEYSHMDIGAANSEGHRALVGVFASFREQEPGELSPLNLLIGATVVRSEYEVEHDDVGTLVRSEPEVITVAGHGGMEYLVPRPLSFLGGAWAFIARVQVDTLGLFVSDFTETSGRTIAGLEEVFVSINPSFEFRRADEISWGFLHTWLEIGGVGFATDPKLEYTVSIGDDITKTRGTMERLFAEVALGMNLIWSEKVELSAFWGGLLGDKTFSNSFSLKAKYAF